MCIIAYIPQGKQIKEETIRYMFEGNPDGAGIMWKPKEGAPVEIRKGFMKVDELIKAYYDIPQNCEKAIHCRIATSGKISTACCHPFPVRAKTNAMREAVDSASVALMHNGIIGYTTPAKGMASDYSDTMLFASKVLYPLQRQLNEWHIQTLIENSTTSRLLIFRQDGETLVMGNWKFEDGIYYSNDNYKETYFGGCYGGYGWLSKSSKSSITNKTEPKCEKKLTTSTATKAETCDDFEDQFDGYEDFWAYYVNIPDTETRSNMEVENEIFEHLETYGYTVMEMETEEYISATGWTERSVHVIINKQLPEGSTHIAGYEIE